jgi:NitT/TauT family transport system substrate-binding protein
MYQELDDTKAHVHRVLDSYDVLGGPSTFNVVWTSQKFHDQNPKIYAAFLVALQTADDLIKNHPKQAALLYIKGENSKLSPAFIKKILRDPENNFTEVPQNVMKYATFLHKTGMIANEPATWSDLFFPEIRSLPGS